MGVLSKRFLERLRSGPPLLLDAAMGTELQRRDAKTTLPLWSAQTLIDDPELVWTIHGDEVAAGAEIVTANTFRTHARTLGKAGLEARAGELSALAVRLAHQAASVPGREVFVAGSLSPLEDCYRPDLVPEQAAVEREHAAQARFLAESGVDLILAETHNSIREAVAATRAAKATGVPVVVSLVTDGSGRLLSGESLGDAAAALLALAPTRSESIASRRRGWQATSPFSRPPRRAFRSSPTATWACRPTARAGALPRSSLPRTTRRRRRAGSLSAPGSSAAAAGRRASTPGRCGALIQASAAQVARPSVSIS